MLEDSRRGSVQTVHGFCVSMLPHTRQISIFSSAVFSAAPSGAMICSRFLIRNSAARRADRGPSPGRRASNWIRRSISGPATAAGMLLSRGVAKARAPASPPPPAGEGQGGGICKDPCERTPSKPLPRKRGREQAASALTVVPFSHAANNKSVNAAAWCSEKRGLKQLHPGRQRQAAGDRFHLFLHHGFRLAARVRVGGHDQVLDD